MENETLQGEEDFLSKVHHITKATSKSYGNESNILKTKNATKLIKTIPESSYRVLQVTFK